MAQHDLPPPRAIAPLSEETVNRIAAGEVVVRPVNAVKELLENSLDASATVVKVSFSPVGSTGAQKAQIKKSSSCYQVTIEDNGCGIRREDLGILCHRFTTSKLAKYEDLRQISTFGFRGEALSSLSHASRMCVTTKTRGTKLAAEANFVDGEVTTAGIKDRPPTGLLGRYQAGTTILFKDLFYNHEHRRRMIEKTPSEEYRKVLDLVQKYAIHNPHVSFVCSKNNSSDHLYNTSGGSGYGNKKEAVIAQLYRFSGSSPGGPASALRLEKIEGCAPELHDLQFELLISGLAKKQTPATGVAGANMGAYSSACSSSSSGATSATTTTTPARTVFFVNNRLVENVRILSAIKKLVPQFSFAYLDLKIAPEAVDVNVHPTKKDVHLLDSDAICECLTSAISDKMEESVKSDKSLHSLGMTKGGPSARLEAAMVGRSLKRVKQDEYRGDRQQETAADGGRGESRAAGLEDGEQGEQEPLLQVVKEETTTGLQGRQDDNKTQTEGAQAEYDPSSKAVTRIRTDARQKSVMDFWGANTSVSLSNALKEFFHDQFVRRLKAKAKAGPGAEQSERKNNHIPLVLRQHYLDMDECEEMTRYVQQSAWIGIVDREKVLLQTGSKCMLVNLTTVSEEATLQLLLLYGYRKLGIPTSHCGGISLHALFKAFFLAGDGEECAAAAEDEGCGCGVYRGELEVFGLEKGADDGEGPHEEGQSQDQDVAMGGAEGDAVGLDGVISRKLAVLAKHKNFLAAYCGLVLHSRASPNSESLKSESSESEPLKNSDIFLTEVPNLYCARRLDPDEVLAKLPALLLDIATVLDCLDGAEQWIANFPPSHLMPCSARGARGCFSSQGLSLLECLDGAEEDLCGEDHTAHCESLVLRRVARFLCGLFQGEEEGKEGHPSERGGPSMTSNMFETYRHELWRTVHMAPWFKAPKKWRDGLPPKRRRRGSQFDESSEPESSAVPFFECVKLEQLYKVFERSC